MKWLSNPLVVGLSTVLVIIFFISLSKTEQKFSESYQKVENLADEVNLLQQENNQLMRRLEEAGTEFSQEKIIRDQLLMQKPGEYVIQLTDDPRKKEQVESSEPQQTPWESWKALLNE